MDHPHASVAVFIDHREPLIAAGLTFLLADVPGIVLLGRRESGLLPAADVVITDHGRGLHLAPQLREGAGAGALAMHLRPAVLVVSANDRENDIRLALAAGVLGVLHAQCSAEDLLRAVRAVAARGRYLCPAMTQRVADSLSHEPLTARETDVLRLLVQGDSNKAIALRLEIAVGTVKAHVKSIMEKLGAHTRTHAVSVATTRGLVADSAPAPVLARRPRSTPRPEALALSAALAA